MRFLLIGNPDNRRVVLFRAALARLDQPEPDIVTWRDLARRPDGLDALDEEPRIVRIDSFGEDDEVTRALLALGHDDAIREDVSVVSPRELARRPMRNGEILAPRQQHLGLLRVLDAMDQSLARRPSWRVLTAPAAIRDLFDKRITSRLYASRGIPVARALTDAADPGRLRASMDARALSMVWVKLASGSSASCLAVLQRHAGSEWLMTTIEATPDGWFNSLTVRRVEQPSHIDTILRWLLREGCHVEENVPKARLANRHFDCRVLVVDGEPAFTVVRTSTHPITNLHLGGRRGDLPLLRAACPAARWDAAMASCREVAALHGAFQVGIDLAFTRGYRAHAVLEANAFGDLLPGLQRDGLDVYAWQITRALRRFARSEVNDL